MIIKAVITPNHTSLFSTESVYCETWTSSSCTYISLESTNSFIGVAKTSIRIMLYFSGMYICAVYLLS